MWILAPLIMALSISAPTHSADISYVTDGSTQDVRFQFRQTKDKLSLYNEVNVKQFANQDSYQTSRVIIQYGFDNLKLTAMGTYSTGYKQHIIGLSANYKTLGLIVGADEYKEPVGMIYGSYKNDTYKLSTSGHIDLLEDLTRGRLDLMYNLGRFKVGYELQFNQSNLTNWFKVGVTL
jgi:hypothetical protein